MVRELIGPVYCTILIGVIFAASKLVPTFYYPIEIVAVLTWFFFFPKMIAISVGKRCGIVRYWTASFKEIRALAK